MKYSQYLDEMRGCPFCGCADRFVAENDYCFLTYANAPYHQDHLLIVPKRHIEHLWDVSKEEFGALYELHATGLMLLKNLGYENISFLAREGKGSGKSIGHIHYHLIPNVPLDPKENGGVERNVLTDQEINTFFEKIKSVLMTDA